MVGSGSDRAARADGPAGRCAGTTRGSGAERAGPAPRLPRCQPCCPGTPSCAHHRSPRRMHGEDEAVWEEAWNPQSMVGAESWRQRTGRLEMPGRQLSLTSAGTSVTTRPSWTEISCGSSSSLLGTKKIIRIDIMRCCWAMARGCEVLGSGDKDKMPEEMRKRKK